AALLPAPPFESYEGMIQVGSAAAPSVTIDFDGVARSKLFAGGPTAPSAAQPTQASRPEPSRRSQPQPQPAPAHAQPVSFAAMSSVPMRSVQPSPANLDLVHDVPLQISAVLGKTALTLRDVVSLQAGSVFELDKLSTDPIDLYVNNILIARGEVVVVDDKYAVKISELNPSVAK
ncbi:MAG: flagellar motor switch protein FliN, partial [Vulcanimicrobiaceae bacterium]